MVSVFEISPIWGFLYSPKDHSDEQITIIGYIVEEPDKRSSNTKLTIQTEQGRVLVTTRKYPEYKYGDELIITGKLETPTVFEDFNYQGYLAKDGIYSVMYYPKICP